MKLEEYAVVDAATTVDNCDSPIRKSAQRGRMSRAQTEIYVAQIRMVGYDGVE